MKIIIYTYMCTTKNLNIKALEEMDMSKYLQLQMLLKK